MEVNARGHSSRPYADGYEGFVPVTAKYTGKGQFKPISKTSVHMVNVRRGDLRGTNFEQLNGVDPTGKEETQLAQSQTTSNRGGLPALLAAAIRTGANLRPAVDMAVLALQSKLACAALFDLPPDTNPADLLLELYGGQSQRGSIELRYMTDPNDNAVASQRLTSLPYITANWQVIQRSEWAPNTGVIAININPQSAFNSGYGNRLQIEVNRAITVIHELGHAANFIFGPFSSRISQVDGGSNPILRNISRLNSLRVRDACF